MKFSVIWVFGTQSCGLSASYAARILLLLLLLLLLRTTTIEKQAFGLDLEEKGKKQKGEEE